MNKLGFNKKELEVKLDKFILKAKELCIINPQLGLRYLNQANNMYDKLGYSLNLNSKINQVTFQYIDKYVLK